MCSAIVQKQGHPRVLVHFGLLASNNSVLLIGPSTSYIFHTLIHKNFDNQKEKLFYFIRFIPQALHSGFSPEGGALVVGTYGAAVDAGHPLGVQ